jgi:large subunit ribosomal protein L1
MFRGKKYRKLSESIDRSKEYAVVEALEILKSSEVRFDQTVEVHMKLGVDPKHADQMVRGNVILPHGTGKKVRVLVFCKGEAENQAKEAGAEFVGAEDLAEKIQGGWLDFDAVVATPDMMPVIGRIARVLGPRGLMPSPKAGTVTVNVAQVVKELKAGKISYRVDKGSNVHAPIGKMSFTESQLEENFQSFLDSVKKNKPQAAKGTYIKSLTITGTMTPPIKLDMGLSR